MEPNPSLWSQAGWVSSCQPGVKLVFLCPAPIPKPLGPTVSHLISITKTLPLLRKSQGFEEAHARTQEQRANSSGHNSRAVSFLPALPSRELRKAESCLALPSCVCTLAYMHTCTHSIQARRPTYIGVYMHSCVTTYIHILEHKVHTWTCMRYLYPCMLTCSHLCA